MATALNKGWNSNGPLRFLKIEFVECSVEFFCVRFAEFLVMYTHAFQLWVYQN